MIRYCCALPFNLNSNVIMQISYRITKYCVYKMRMFNHSLHFIETKAVLEGRGFKPNFLVRNADNSLVHPKLTGFNCGTVSGHSQGSLIALELSITAASKFSSNERSHVFPPKYIRTAKTVKCCWYIRQVKPIRCFCTSLWRVSFSPVNAAILPDRLLSVWMQPLYNRLDRICQNDALGMLLKIFHKRTVGVWQLGMIGECRRHTSSSYCLVHRLFRAVIVDCTAKF